MNKNEWYCMTLLREEQTARENYLYTRHLLDNFSVASYIDRLTQGNCFDRDFVSNKVGKMLGFRIREYLNAKLDLLDIERRWKEAAKRIEVNSDDC